MENIINTLYSLNNTEEHTIVSPSFEHAKKQISINSFLTHSIHKLFDNVKSGQIFHFESSPNSTFSVKHMDLHFENLSSRRTLIFDNSSLYKNSDLNQNLEIITQIPEAFEKSFLSVELAILQKAYENTNISEHIELSDYAKKLNYLVQSLYSKSISEIQINDSVVMDILQHQTHQKEQLKLFEQQIHHLKKQMSTMEKDNSSLYQEINSLEKTQQLKSQNNHEITEQIQELDKDLYLKLKNKFNLIDKLKIKIFETFGVTGVEDILIKSKTQKNLNLVSHFELKKDYLNSTKDNNSKEIDMISQRIQNFKTALETNKSKIQLLSESLILLNESQKTLVDKTFITPHQDLHHHLDRSLEKISDDKVFSIHVFPEEVLAETTPLKENINFDERILAIRSLNPSISTSTYRLTGESFSNKTFNKGIIGVLIGKGHISSVHHGDAGTIVNNDGDRETLILTDFKENLNMLKTRGNVGLDYNEVVVNNSVPYAKIIQLDSLAKRISDDSPDHAFVHVKNTQINTQTWLNEIEHLFNGHKEKEYGLKPLPVVLMLNGKLLEIQSANHHFKDDNLIPDAVNLHDFEKIISKKFQINEIKNLQSIHNTQHDIPKDIRSNIVANIITKYKNNIVSFIQKDLEEKHNIKLNISPT